MNAQRFPEEFKIEAVKQILKHGHSVADVSRRLGVSTASVDLQHHAYVPSGFVYTPVATTLGKPSR